MPRLLASPHDDVIKWKYFPRYWPFVRGIHRSPVNSPDKGQWRGALMFSLICSWINSWVNNREAGDLRRHHAHYDVIVMKYETSLCQCYRLNLATSSYTKLSIIEKWIIYPSNQPDYRKIYNLRSYLLPTNSEYVRFSTVLLHDDNNNRYREAQWSA